jgi:hypothetical protein
VILQADKALRRYNNQQPNTAAGLTILSLKAFALRCAAAAACL